MTARTIETGPGVRQAPVAGSTIRSRRIQRMRIIARLVAYVGLIGGSLMYVIPFVWMVRASLMSIDMFYEDPQPLFPDPPAFNNFADVWQIGPFFWWIANSTIVSFVAVTAGTLISAIVAFGFARLRFPGSRIFFLIVIST